jgi:hypothetical protein
MSSNSKIRDLVLRRETLTAEMTRSLDEYAFGQCISLLEIEEKERRGEYSLIPDWMRSKTIKKIK